jgi:hypothetical protein
MRVKQISIVLFTTFLFIGCTGMQQITEADRTFERIVPAPGHSKDEIYDSVKMWIAENFRSAKAVIEYDNKVAGTIIGNGNMKYPCSGLDCIAKNNWTVPFTMRVDTKDEKFRLTFSNLKVSWPPSYNATVGYQKGHTGPVNTKGDFDAIKPRLLALGEQILSSINNGVTNSNW